MKLLIVDDSALMRKQLGELFEQAGGFAVAFARNGREAVSMNLEFAPDVVTLDINMPELDGLSALAEMMLQRPVPVIMLSSLTAQGALATFEALALGAVDYVAKPGGTISLGIDALRAELVAKVRGAAKAKVRGPDGAPTATSTRTAGRTVARPPEPAEPACASTVPLDARQPGVVVIGVSTGGPRTLERILPQLPAHFPWPVVVAQHMPTSFTAPFAERLGRLCALRVVEAAQPMPLAAGTVYVCKGGADSIFTTRNGRPTLVSRPPDATQLWHPSVSLLGASALQLYAPQAIVGVMLTGMGSDGAEAFADIRQAGGRTIAESEQSAVVFGMPAELIRRGGASSVLPADRIAGQLIQWLCPSPDTNHVDTEPIMPLNKSTGMSSAGIPEVARATALASLQAADPALRRSAAQTLAGQPEAVPVILDALERESSLAVRTALLDSLAATPGDEAVQALAGCLRSEDAWLRNAAIDLLRGMPEQVAPVIAHMLIDPETDIRILAVGILDTLRHARVEDWLLQLIDAETDVNVCGAALEVLTTIGTSAAIGPVTTLMRRFADEPYITFAGRLLLNRLGRGA